MTLLRHASTQEAGLGLPPEDCALILGLTHLLSSLLSLVVRQLVGRRPLLLVSQAGMGLAMLATGLYLSNTGSQQQADPGHSGNTTLDTGTGTKSGSLVSEDSYQTDRDLEHMSVSLRPGPSLPETHFGDDDPQTGDMSRSVMRIFH